MRLFEKLKAPAPKGVIMQHELNDYYATCISPYSPSNLSAVITAIQHIHFKTLVFNEDSVRCILNIQFWNNEVDIPRKDFKNDIKELEINDDLVSNLLVFFAEIDTKIISQIRGTWFPIALLSGFEYKSNGFVTNRNKYFYLHCPKTGHPYQCEIINEEKIRIVSSFYILSYNEHD